MKKILTLILLSLFFLGLTSALDFNIDNYKEFKSVENSKYGSISIYDKGQFGEDTKLQDIALTSNTETCPDNHCEAVFRDVKLYSNSKLFDYIRFEDINTGKVGHPTNIKLYIKSGEQSYSQDIYNESCSSKISNNGSSYNECNNVNLGKIEKQREIWEEINPSTTLDSGNYDFKITGDIKGTDKIDWVLGIKGIETTEWSQWGGSTLNTGLVAYYKLDQNYSSQFLDSVSGRYNGTFIDRNTTIITTGVIINASRTQTPVNVDSSWNTTLSPNTTALTISLWINSSQYDNIDFMHMASTQCNVNPNVNGQFRTFNSGGGGLSLQINDSLSRKTIVSGTLNNNTYQMLTYVFNQTNVSLYVNGTIKSSVAVVGLNFSGLASLELRHRGNTACGQDTAVFALDEVAVYNRTLSSTEVLSLYGNQSNNKSYPFGAVEITVNAPLNNQMFNTRTVTFNISVAHTAIVNISVLTNVSGKLSVNQTSTATGNADNKQFINITFNNDGYYLVGGQSCDTDGDCGYSANSTIFIDSINPAIVMNSPINNSYIYSYNSSTTGFFLNFTATDPNLNSCWWNATFDSSLHFITCNTVPQINITNVFGFQELTAYTNDTANNTVMNKTSFYIHKVINNNVQYETQSNNYSLELWNLSVVPTNYNFTQNGNSYIPTLYNLGSNRYELNYTVDTPTGSVFNYSWSFYDTEQRLTTNYSQNINQINFAQCNSTITTPYLNISFVNETTGLEAVNATLSGTVSYWLGSGTINKTYTYINGSENRFYLFCFSPVNNSLNTNVNFQYANSYSTSRTFISNYILNNVVSNQVLYLLPDILSLVTRYKTVNTNGNIISGVLATVSRLIGSTTITLSGLTDSSGQIAFALNPLVSYDYTFAKDGFTTASFSLTPNSIDTYVITLGGSSSGLSNGSTIANNLSYQIFPLNSSLNNNTVYTFAFNVSGNPNINYISMNITDGNGGSLSVASINSTGIISSNVNTQNYTRIIGYYQIQTLNENYSFTYVWVVGNEYIGDYSLFRQLRIFRSDYGFGALIRILMASLVIILSMVYLSKNEVIDTSESKILVGLLLVWAFSLVGWFDTGLVSTATGNAGRLAQFSSQYGIAIVSSALGSWFIFRRILT